MQGVLAADRHYDYHRAPDLDAAVAMLATGPCRILAGGTDVFPSLQIARSWVGSGYFWHSGFTPDTQHYHWSIGAAVSWRIKIRAALRPLRFESGGRGWVGQFKLATLLATLYASLADKLPY